MCDSWCNSAAEMLLLLSVIFVNENENGEKQENKKFVNEN